MFSAFPSRVFVVSFSKMYRYPLVLRKTKGYTYKLNFVWPVVDINCRPVLAVKQ